MPPKNRLVNPNMIGLGVHPVKYHGLHRDESANPKMDIPTVKRDVGVFQRPRAQILNKPLAKGRK